MDKQELSRTSTAYNMIMNKFKDGTYKRGEKLNIQRYYYENKTIDDIPVSKRTPGICSGMMSYGKCHLLDVPKESLTKGFYIDAFTNDEVNEYIKKHLEEFDRQFFKDLIENNGYATSFYNNCFAVMPIDYIDEEMCSIAIINSLDWSNNDWFYTVKERKPEALTPELWSLGARLYARMSGDVNEFLSMTPIEYRNIGYYSEMCKCNFNVGMKLTDNKGKIMNSVPDEVITIPFVMNLLNQDMENVARFNENALELELNYTDKNGIKISEKIWQFVVKTNGHMIRYIDLNDERIEYFLDHYDKDSSEYRYAFKSKYKVYLKQQNNLEQYQRQQKREENYWNQATTLMGISIMDSIINGTNPTSSIDLINKVNMNRSLYYLPIRYKGKVPEEYAKKYDSEEYLEVIYRALGIDILEEYDNVFYSVSLPEGFVIEKETIYNYIIKDQRGNTIINYFYDSKIYDREAYVRSINIPEYLQERVERELCSNNFKIRKHTK